VFDQVRQPRIRGIGIKLDAAIPQPRRDFGGRLVRKETSDIAGKSPHDRQILSSLRHCGIAQRLQPDAVGMAQARVSRICCAIPPTA
jgi:hypothetical protein